MRDFDFCSPTQFIFGRGGADRIGSELAKLGSQNILVTYGQGSVEHTGLLEEDASAIYASAL